MSQDTIVPRPALKPTVTLVLQLDRFREFDQRELGIIESEINSEYREPNDMGELAITFTSDLPDQGFQSDTLTIKTSATELSEDIIEDIIGIVELKVGNIVDTWNVRSEVRRESSVSDYL